MIRTAYFGLFFIASFYSTAAFGSDESLSVADNESRFSSMGALIDRYRSSAELSRIYPTGSRDYESIAISADYALLAWAAYGDREAYEAARGRGWTPLRNYGVPNEIDAAPAVATLFFSESDGHVLAFRGSTKSRGDWRTNLDGSTTGDKESQSYAQLLQAAAIAEEVADQIENVKFVGHSLGGRMAIIAALENDTEAAVFNVAPFGRIESARWPKLSRTIPSSIQSFRGKLDPLTLLPGAGAGASATTVYNGLWEDGEFVASRDHGIRPLALAMQEVRLAIEANVTEGSQELIPTAVGNVWEYSLTVTSDTFSNRIIRSQEIAGTSDTLSHRILRSQEIAGTTWYLYEEESFDWWKDTSELTGEVSSTYVWQRNKDGNVIQADNGFSKESLPENFGVEVWFQAPMNQGSTIDWGSFGSGTTSHVRCDEPVVVPAGRFDCHVYTMTGTGEEGYSRYVVALGIGIVRIENKIGEKLYELELISYELK